MTDAQDIEKEAKDHATLVDEGIGDADREADAKTGGKEQGVVDEGSQAVEKDLGGESGGGGAQPDSTSPM